MAIVAWRWSHENGRMTEHAMLPPTSDMSPPRTAPDSAPVSPERELPVPARDTLMGVDALALRTRYDAIARELAVATTPDARAALKAEIVSLFRDADAAVTAAGQFKDAVKGLAETWKQGEGRAASPAHARSRPAVTGRVDHLGASTYVEKGWSKLSMGDAVGAEVALRRALDLAPGDNEAETLLGWAQMAQEHYDAALLTFHNVLMREPQHPLARTNVGFICLRKGIYGEAIEHLSRAIRLDTDRKATLYAHLYLGMVYRERDMFDDAEPFFKRALELGPNLLQAWYELGRARWFAGRRDEARDAWQCGADANKFNPWGKRCAETLLLVDQGGAPPRGA
ncbi:MAG TPA: tetratricopeptide repeat protein [Gemmatimonas sp.]|nr:tetratricopeptide repeat protein [Gemmatimonas sp.]